MSRFSLGPCGGLPLSGIWPFALHVLGPAAKAALLLCDPIEPVVIVRRDFAGGAPPQLCRDGGPELRVGRNKTNSALANQRQFGVAMHVFHHGARANWDVLASNKTLDEIDKTPDADLKAELLEYAVMLAEPPTEDSHHLVNSGYRPC